MTATNTKLRTSCGFCGTLDFAGPSHGLRSVALQLFETLGGGRTALLERTTY